MSEQSFPENFDDLVVHMADVGVLNVHKALANHPAALQKFMEFAQVVYFENSMPDAKTRELPYLTSAVANNCFY